MSIREINQPERSTETPAIEQTPNQLRDADRRIADIERSLDSITFSAKGHVQNHNPDFKNSDNAFIKLSEYMTSHNYGPDDFDTYSNDPKWRALQKQAFPDFNIAGLDDPSNKGDWPYISKELSFEENLAAVNPNYADGLEWQDNCQRCVPAYEMRRRGYDVTSTPSPISNNILADDPFAVWEKPIIFESTGTGKQDIETSMHCWGSGARAQIVVYWEGRENGHTFIAEQINDATIFYDSQTGETDCSYYFEMAKVDSTQYCRIDNLNTSDQITACCKGIKYD